MLRRGFTIASAVSLVLCLATACLSVWTYHRHYVINGYTRHAAWAMAATDGRIVFLWDTSRPDGRTWFSFWAIPSRFNFWEEYRWWGTTGTHRLPVIGEVARMVDGWYAVVSCWCLVMLFAIAPARTIMRSRAKRGFCRECGYDLRATPDRCPECGTVPVVKK